MLVPSTVVSRDFRLEPEYMVTAGELYPNSQVMKGTLEPSGTTKRRVILPLLIDGKS